jgi:polysaccharide export outer membrane protein
VDQWISAAKAELGTIIMKLSLVSILGVALIITSCATEGLRDVSELTQQDSSVDRFSAEYLIGVDDRLSVNVWGNPDLSVQMPVRPDGRFSMPLIGDVEAGGQSPSQVAERITEMLKVYVRDPNVTVLVTDLRSTEFVSRIRVTGAVRDPSSMNYRAGMTILDAILAAGGPNDFASIGRTRLHRKVGDDVLMYAIPLDRILNDGDIESNVELAPGDVITVPERLL